MHICAIDRKAQVPSTKPQCLLGIHPGESDSIVVSVAAPPLQVSEMSQPRTVSRSVGINKVKGRKLSASGQTLMLRDLRTFSDQEDFS